MQPQRPSRAPLRWQDPNFHAPKAVGTTALIPLLATVKMRERWARSGKMA
jgi:hypothetical protein